LPFQRVFRRANLALEETRAQEMQQQIDAHARSQHTSMRMG